MHVYGTVRDAAEGAPLPGAKVSLYIGEEELAVISSDEKGEFLHSVEASYIGQTLTCQVEKEKYQTKKVTHKIEQGEVRLAIELTSIEQKIEFSLNIKDEEGNPLEGVDITLEVDGEQVGTGHSDKAGLFETTLRPDLKGKTLNYKAEFKSYESVKGEVQLEKETSCQIKLEKLPIPRPSRKWLKIAVGIAALVIVVLIVVSLLIPRPGLTFTVNPERARRGEEVVLYLSEKRYDVMVLYNGRPLPKKTTHDGQVVTVTIPGNAESGFFELAWNGHSVQASKRFIVLE